MNANILFTESSPNIGGQEIQAISQMIALRKQGCNILLACRENSKIASEAHLNGIDIVFISYKNSIHFSSIFKMNRVIKKFKPQLVICHSGHDSNIIGLTRFFFRKKSFRIIRQKTYITETIKIFSLNYFCDEVIVTGTEMKKRLRREGVCNNITVVHPGFDFPVLYKKSLLPLPPHIINGLSSGKDRPVILQVGMLRPEKGHEFMLKVLYRLKQEGRAYRWMVVGSGHKEYVKKLQDQIDCLDMKTGDVYPDGGLPGGENVLGV